MTVLEDTIRKIEEWKKRGYTSLYDHEMRKVVDDALEILREYKRNYPRICSIIEEEVDAVDIESVKHGRWIDENPASFLDPRMRCSVCGHVDIPLAKWRFCPMCGAKMDKEADNGTA